MFGKKKFESIREQHAYDNARLQERTRRAGIAGKQSVTPIAERLAGVAVALKGTGARQSVKSGGGLFSMGAGFGNEKMGMFSVPENSKKKKSMFQM